MNVVVLGLGLEHELLDLGLQVLRVVLALVLLSEASLVLSYLLLQVLDVVVELLDLLA